MHKKVGNRAIVSKVFCTFACRKQCSGLSLASFQVREESPGSIEHPTSETRSYW